MFEPRVEIDAPSADVEMTGAESSENPAQETQPETEKEKEKETKETPANGAPAEEEKREEEGPPSQANKFLE